MRLPVSIAGIVFRQTPSGREYLLLHRIPERGGFWQPITGGLETTDESLHSCVLRELGEELGISSADVLCIVPDFFVRQFPGKHPDYGGDKMVDEHWFGIEVASTTAVVLSDEHDAMRWAPIDDAIALLKWEGNKEGFRALHGLLSSAEQPKPL